MRGLGVLGLECTRTNIMGRAAQRRDEAGAMEGHYCVCECATVCGKMYEHMRVCKCVTVSIRV